MYLGVLKWWLLTFANLNNNKNYAEYGPYTRNDKSVNTCMSKSCERCQDYESCTFWKIMWIEIPNCERDRKVTWWGNCEICQGGESVSLDGRS